MARPDEVSCAVGPVYRHGDLIEDFIRLRNYKDGAAPPLTITISLSLHHQQHQHQSSAFFSSLTSLPGSQNSLRLIRNSIQ